MNPAPCVPLDALTKTRLHQRKNVELLTVAKLINGWEFQWLWAVGRWNMCALPAFVGIWPGDYP